MISRCTICHNKLDQPNKPESKDCGGDCLSCMARCGDPDAIKTVDKLFIKEVKQIVKRYYPEG